MHLVHSQAFYVCKWKEMNEKEKEICQLIHVMCADNVCRYCYHDRWRDGSSNHAATQQRSNIEYALRTHKHTFSLHPFHSLLHLHHAVSNAISFYGRNSRLCIRCSLASFSSFYWHYFELTFSQHPPYQIHLLRSIWMLIGWVRVLAHSAHLLSHWNVNTITWRHMAENETLKSKQCSDLILFEYYVRTQQILRMHSFASNSNNHIHFSRTK